MSDNSEACSSSSSTDEINIVVKGSNGTLKFKIKKNSTLEKVMKIACTQMNLSRDDTRFLYNNERLHGYETAKQLEMEDGDEIDVFQRQDGGSQ